MLWHSIWPKKTRFPGLEVGDSKYFLLGSDVTLEMFQSYLTFSTFSRLGHFLLFHTSEERPLPVNLSTSVSLTLPLVSGADEFSSNLACSCVAMERTLFSRSSPSSPAGGALWQDNWTPRAGEEAKTLSGGRKANLKRFALEVPPYFWEIVVALPPPLVDWILLRLLLLLPEFG